MKHPFFLLAAVVALFLTSCGRRSSTAEDRNAAFLAAIPSNFPDEARQFLRACVARSAVHGFQNSPKKYPSLVEALFAAEARGETELYVPNTNWGDIELLGDGLGSFARPPRASHGSDWRPGYTIVIHLMPVPEHPGGDLPAGATLVFRWVRTDKAAKTKYHVLPPDDEAS
jgi:hypothetical protein